MNVKKYEEITKKDWYRMAGAILLFIAVIGLSSILLLPDYCYLWMLVIITGTLLLVDWHTKNFAYRCPSCGEVFEVSPLENFLGPDGVNQTACGHPNLKDGVC